MAFMFFYNLSDYKKVGFRLKHENFDYPVCLNRSEELSRLNNIREGDRNHTFFVRQGKSYIGNRKSNV